MNEGLSETSDVELEGLADGRDRKEYVYDPHGNKIGEKPRLSPKGMAAFTGTALVEKPDEATVTEQSDVNESASEDSPETSESA